MIRFFLFCLYFTFTLSYLYPRESETRELKYLNGIWAFRPSPKEYQHIGFHKQWHLKPLSMTGETIPMPVPSSYNDITQNRTIRDYIGWVWYDTEFFVSKRWETTDTRVILNFGSVHFFAVVFVNGQKAVWHRGGHLPFQADVTDLLAYGTSNRMTVAVNNTLTEDTIPQGQVIYYTDTDKFPEGFAIQTLNFDFFNYAGIHRSVVLYAVPSIYIDDITILTDVGNDGTGVVSYSIKYQEKGSSDWSDVVDCYVKIYDAHDDLVAESKGCQEAILIPNANLWWPVTMHPNPGYLYTMKAQLATFNSTIDVYYQRFGIRKVQVSQSSFLINGRPFYFMGFGKHEDSNIRGKGLDLPLIVKDFNLIKWIGANAFRTSHYPYSEELMDLADSQGIVVIDECPAVGLNSFTDSLLKQHVSIMEELIARDKNRPSVVMWSVANEPKSMQYEAMQYFRELVKYTKKLDKTRPVSAALNSDCTRDRAGQFMDVVMMNKYFGWYSTPGYSQVITKQVVEGFAACYDIYRKPLMISEYGADTVSGLHMDPPFMFSEDYQVDLLVQNHRAFDVLREKGFFVGELIWNFADFMTDQNVNRVMGNKKGIFTRERQPKAAARILRCRYLRLANATADDSLAYCPSRL